VSLKKITLFIFVTNHCALTWYMESFNVLSDTVRPKVPNPPKFELLNTTGNYRIHIRKRARTCRRLIGSLSELPELWVPNFSAKFQGDHSPGKPGNVGIPKWSGEVNQVCFLKL